MSSTTAPRTSSRLVSQHARGHCKQISIQVLDRQARALCLHAHEHLLQ
jgi:hypothetical protein